MNNDTKRVVLINASPKVSESSVSGMLTGMMEETMKAAGIHVTSLDVRQSLRQGHTEADFETMLQADALVLTFPLYIFCLPGLLMRFLQDYDAFCSKRLNKGGGTRRIYTVVNCGFSEADINQEAVRVIKSFSKKTNNVFRFGVMIGGGGMLLGAKDAPFVRKTIAMLSHSFKIMAEDIINSAAAPIENISVKMNFPRRLYHFMGNRGWFYTAKKNGLKKKELYRKPYIEEIKSK